MKVVKYIQCLLVVATLFLSGGTAKAQSHSDYIDVGIGALYQRGFDATLSWEHETKNHNAWEYFVNGYLKYDDDEKVGHITPKSFWSSYNTYSVGAAYKPCILHGGIRHGRNHYGSLKLGASIGSDTHEFVGWVNVGYEQNYVLKHGWHLYWQVKSDLCINGKDLFRSGVVIGVKLPYRIR